MSFLSVISTLTPFSSDDSSITSLIPSILLSFARVLTFLMEKGLTFVFLTLLSFTTGSLVIIQTILIQIIVMVLNYVFSKLFVFRKK